MSVIDERVVELSFNNKNFENGARQSISTLERLKGALNLDSSAKSLQNLQKVSDGFSLSNITNGLNRAADGVQAVTDRFSTMGIVGAEVIRKLTDSALTMAKNIFTAVPNQIISGGKRRAQNIEQAKFQLKGLLKEDFDWDEIKKDLDYGVSGTAYGLDAAAKVAAQLRASNVQFGTNMQTALRSISGVAAMTNSSYEEIGHIYTAIAGQGKLGSMQLQQLSLRGLNIAAELGNQLHKTEAEIRQMVTKGQIDFQTFANAMDAAFGEQAKKANDTFSGALSNVKASLSRIGEMFATPAYDNLRIVLVDLIDVFNDFKKVLEPVAEKYKQFVELVAGSTSGLLKNVHEMLQGYLQLRDSQKQAVENASKGLNGVAGITRLIVSNTKEEKEAVEATAKSYEDLEKVANEVLAGKHGYGEERKKNIEALGFSFAAVQNKVNEMLGVSKRYDETEKSISDTTKQTTDNLNEQAETLDTVEKKYQGIAGITKVLQQSQDQSKNTVEDTKKEYEELEALANEVINGKYGYGEERKKKLEELGVSYNVVQNKVNELLGATKRYEVTAEDEVKTAAYFGKTVTETTEESAKKASVFVVNSEKVNTTLQGIAAAFDIIKQAGTAFYNTILLPFISWGVPRILDLILTLTSSIGKKIIELRDNLKSTDFFNTRFKAIADAVVNAKEKFDLFIESAKNLEGVKALSAAFERLKTALKELWSKTIGKLQKGFSELGQSVQLPKMDFFLGILDAVTSKLAEFINYILDNKDSISGFFAPLKSFGSTVFAMLKGGLSEVTGILSGAEFGGGLGTIGDFINLLGQLAKALGGGLLKGLMTFGEGMSKAFGGVKLENLISILTSGGIATVAVNAAAGSKGLKVFANALKNMAINLNKEGIAGMFAPLADTLTVFEKKLNAQALKELAIAIGILAVSLLILASIDTQKLVNGIAGIGALMFELYLMFQNMSKLTPGEGTELFDLFKFNAMSKFLTGVAIAVGILAVSMKIISGISWEGIAKGLLSIAALMVMLRMFVDGADTDKKGMVATAVGLILLGMAIKVLAKAMKIIGKLSWDELAKGLVGVAGALLSITLAMRFMPTSGMIGAGFGILIVAVALKSIAKVIRDLGQLSWDEITKGLLSIGGAMIFIAGIMSLMPEKGMIGASVGIFIVAMAFKSIAKVMKEMAALSWEEIAKGMTVLAGSMMVIAAAGTLMSSTKGFAGSAAGLLVMAIAIRVLVPVLTALGGLSIGEIVKSLVALAAAFALIWAAAIFLKPLTGTLVALSGAFFLFGLGAAALGVGITAIAIALTTLAGSAGAIALTIVTVIGAVLRAIIDNVTTIVNAVVALGMAILTAIKTLVPEIISTVFTVIIAALEGVLNNIGKIVAVVSNIIIVLLETLAIYIPNIVNAGLVFATAFINGLADGLKNNAGPLFDAIKNLVEGLITFALTAIISIIKMIPGIGEVLGSALEGLVGDTQNAAASVESTLKGIAVPEEKKVTIKAIVTDLKNANGEEYKLKLDELEAEIDHLAIPLTTRNKLLKEAFENVEKDAEQKLLVTFDALNAEVNSLKIEGAEKKKLLGLIKAMASGDKKELILATLEPTIGTLSDLSETDKNKLMNYAQGVIDAEEKVGVTFTTLTATIGEFKQLTEEQKTDLQNKINGLTTTSGSAYTIGFNNLMAYIGTLGLDGDSAIRLKSCAQEYLDSWKEHRVLFNNMKAFAGDLGFTPEGLNDFLNKVKALGGQEGTQYDVFFSSLTPSIGVLGTLSEDDQKKLFGYVQQVVTDHGAVEVAYNNLTARLGEFTELTDDQKTELETRLNTLVNSSGMQYQVQYGNLKAWIGTLGLELGSETRLKTYLQTYINENYNHKVSLGNLQAYVASLGLEGDALTHFIEEVEGLGSVPEGSEGYTVTIDSLSAYLDTLNLSEKAKLDLLGLAQAYCDAHENAFNAKVKLLSVTIGTTEFEGDSEKEREALEQKVRALTGLQGTTLKVALDRLRVDIVNASMSQQAKETALHMIEGFADMLGNAYTRRLQEAMESQKATPLYINTEGEQTVEIKAFSTVEKALQSFASGEGVDLEGAYNMLADKLKFDNADNSIAADIVKSFLGDEFTEEEFNEMLMTLFPEGTKGNKTVLDKEAFMNLLGGVHLVDNLEQYVEETFEGLDLSDAQKAAVKKFKEVLDPYNMETDEQFSVSLQEQLKRWGVDVDLTQSENIYKDVIDQLLDMDPEDLEAIFATYPALEDYINNWVKTMTFDDPEHYRKTVSKGIEEATEEGFEDGVNEATGKFDMNELVETALNSDDTEAAKAAAEQITALYKSGAEGASKDEIMAALKENVNLQGYIDELAAEGVDTSNIYDSILTGLRMGSFGQEDEGNIIETLGKSIDEGLATGMTDNMDIATQAAETVVDSVNTEAYDTAESKSPSKVFMRLGRYIDEGLALGLILGKSKVIRQMMDVVKAAINTAKDRITRFNAVGADSGAAFATGLSDQTTLARIGAEMLSLAAEWAIRLELDTAEDLGEDWGRGFVKGLESQVDEARAAGRKLANAPKEEIENLGKIASPSKVAKRLGNFWGMGYVIGLNEYVRKAGKAGRDLGDATMHALETPMQIIQDILDSDVDVTPVITPVLDLRDIQNGARRINNLLPAGAMDLGAITYSMANRHETTNADVVSAILGLSGSMEGSRGDTYNINGVTYDDGSNIVDAVQTLVRAARVERRR